MKYFSLLFLIVLVSCSSFKIEQDSKKKLYRVLWSKNLDPQYDSGNLPISFHSPLIHDGLLFMGAPDGRMTAYNIDNGREIWVQKEANGIANQPAIFENNVLYGTEGGRLVARNYATGALDYEVDLGEGVESKTFIDASGKGYVQLRNHALISFDASTGKILWSYRRSISQSTTIQQVADPTLYQGKLYVGFADGSLVAFNPDDGKILWETHLAEGTKFVDVNMTPAFKDNLLYAGSLSGPLTILNHATGEVVLKYPFQVMRAPLWKGEDMIVGTYDGDLLLTNKEGDVQKKTSLNSTIFSTLLVKDHLVAATRDGQVYFVKPDSLAIEEKYHLGHAFSVVFGHLCAQDNKLAVFSSRNHLYVFEILQ